MGDWLLKFHIWRVRRRVRARALLIADLSDLQRSYLEQANEIRRYLDRLTSEQNRDLSRLGLSPCIVRKTG